MEQAPPTPAQLRGFNTLDEQVAKLRTFAANPKQRTPFGLEELDNLVLGPAEGEVFTFVARSFVGKSLLATNFMANNPDTEIIFFSLEMTSHQVLQRLYAHVFNTPSADVQSAVRTNVLPSQLGELAVRLPQQVVIDKPALTLDDMTGYLNRYETFYGVRPRIVIMDYLEEIGGGKAGAEGWIRTEATASSVKVWAKEEQIGVLMLHQANQKTEPWEPVSPGSAKGGGFTEADVVIGGWRPGFDPDLGDVAQYERRNWFHMNVLKNRVLGERSSEMRFIIDPAMRLVKQQERLRLQASLA